MTFDTVVGGRGGIRGRFRRQPKNAFRPFETIIVEMINVLLLGVFGGELGDMPLGVVDININVVSVDGGGDTLGEKKT